MTKKLQSCKETAASYGMKKSGRSWSRFLKPAHALCALACCLLGFTSISESNAQTNYALSFSGSNQYGSVNNPSSLNFGSSTDFTLEAIVVLTGSNNNSFNGLVSKATSGFPWTGYQIAVYQNKLVGEIMDGTTLVGTSLGLQGTTSLNDGRPHHVAMVVSRSSNNAKLYVDGNLEASVTNAALGNNISNSANLYIGVERGQSIFFSGLIDEVRIWNTARTQAEIQANKYISVSPSSSGLVSYYNTYLYSNTLLIDNSTGNNNGDLNNGAAWTTTTLAPYTYTVSSNSAFRDIGVNLTGVNTSDISSQVYTYNGGTWSPYSGSMSPGQGYRAQFAGNSSVSIIGRSVPTAVPVIPELNTGALAYSFVGNPYDAVLDMDLFFNTTSGLQLGYWYLDPTNIVGGYQGYKYYGTLIGASNTYGGGLTLGKYVQPGQGFFVQNDEFGDFSGPFLEFHPDQIVSGNTTNVFGAKALNRISTGLFKAGKNVDGAVVVFNSQFTTGYDKYDASKISNQGENLTFKLGNKDLCANAWGLPTEKDILPLHLYNLQAKTAYTLKLNASEFVGNGLDAYLQDNVANTKSLLSGANNEITFTTGADVTAFASRYNIVFGASALPVKNISLTAAKLSGSQVSIKWSTIGESNISSYKIERSSNGNTFAALATVSPSTAHNYSYIDAAATGTNYYRIKVTDVTGAVSYSSVVKVAASNNRVSVYPNPVVGANFKIDLGNSGKYNVNVVNLLGQNVYSTVVNHTSGTLSSVALSKQLAAGNYRLIAVDEDGTSSSTALTIK